MPVPASEPDHTPLTYIGTSARKPKMLTMAFYSSWFPTNPQTPRLLFSTSHPFLWHKYSKPPTWLTPPSVAIIRTSCLSQYDDRELSEVEWLPSRLSRNTKGEPDHQSEPVKSEWELMGLYFGQGSNRLFAYWWYLCRESWRLGCQDGKLQTKELSNHPWIKSVQPHAWGTLLKPEPSLGVLKPVI